MKIAELKSMSRIMALAMMIIATFTACSDDDGEGNKPIVFPELKNINCAAGETAEISFETTADWELSSSAGWCKFQNGEFLESLIYGKAGKQTVTIATSADGQSHNEDAVAEITLKILHRYFSEGHAIVPNFVLKPTFLAPAGSLIYKKYIAPIQACKVDCIVFCREIKWQAEALELMQKILKAQESDKDRELVTLFLTQELWHLLYLHMDSEVLQKKRENTASSQGRTQLMMQYIHQNFRQNLTLEDIAGQAMVSKSTALNLFRRYLHDTPVHYLVKYRLQEAAKLLATTEKKITVISGETGFENMDYFCKTFKKYYGRTPTEYRRKKQMDTDDREWIVQDVV